MTNNVTLFANNNAVATHLPNDLAIFFRKHPDVRITLEERMTHEILAAVADGRADLGVVAHQESYPELSFIPYRQDKLVLITPQGHPLLQMDEVSFSQCLAYPFICLQPGAAVHTFLMSNATALGERMDIRVQVSGYDAVVKLVASGAGIGIVPNSAIGDRESAGLGVIDISDTWAIRDLRVCVSRQAAPNPARDRLIEILCTA